MRKLLISLFVCSLAVGGRCTIYYIQNTGVNTAGTPNMNWNFGGYTQCQVGGNELQSYSGGSLASGATWTYTYGGGLDGAGVEITWTSGGNGADGACQCQRLGNLSSSGGPYYWTFSPGGAAPSTTNYCTSCSYLNVTTSPEVCVATVNGVCVSGLAGGVSGYTVASCPGSYYPPGALASYQACATNPISSAILVYDMEGDLLQTITGTNQVNSPSSTNSPTPPLGLSTNVLGTVWTTNLFPSGGTNVSGEFSTIYQGIANLGTAVSSELGAIQNTVSNINVHTAGGSGGGSNYIAITVTNNNAMTLTNQISVSNTNQVNLSNFLSVIYSNSVVVTNGYVAPTGSIFSGSSAMIGLVPSAATNYADAVALAGAASGMSAAQGAFQSITSGMGTALSGVLSGDFGASGSDSMFDIPFAAAGPGYVLHLNPESSVLSGILAIIKAAWSFIVLTMFLRWLILEWLIPFARDACGMQTGGVPDLDAELAGFGGNVAGLVVALAIPFAIILGVGALLFAAASMTTGYITELASASSALSLGGNGGAIYLLVNSFPVPLAISCLISRFVIPVTAEGMHFLTAMGMRFLLGR